jgi:hypothetical protein
VRLPGLVQEALLFSIVYELSGKNNLAHFMTA